MIYLIEPMFKKWEHVQCNVGMANLVCSIIDKDVVFLGSNEHINALKNMGLDSRIRCCDVEFPKVDYYVNEQMVINFKEKASSLFKEYQINKNDIVISLSSPDCVETTLIELSEVYETQLFFVHHAELDWVLSGRLPKLDWIRMTESLKLVGDSSYAKCIVYNPYVSQKLKECLSQGALDKFSFIHHPVQGKPITAKEVNENNIAIYGAGDNANLRKILHSLSTQYPNYDYNNLFLMRRCSLDGLEKSYLYPKKMKNIIDKVDGCTQQEIDSFINDKGWILLPYDETMYQVSASGILADAITWEKPILALSSPIINFYQEQYEIGFVEKSPEKLAQVICDNKIREENYQRFVENIKLLKKKINLENQIYMKNLLS